MTYHAAWAKGAYWGRKKIAKQLSKRARRKADKRATKR
jgi:hypothetical protein